ncbi:antitoxin Xre/MbcA/ParS toxin-binding domain-containing protein [Mesorhizobium australicum]|uniref:RNA polymerase, sigma 54 subunit, RpoN/SigL n=1 Tax=Mesorhizobium australicum TaxID=536018 RepID=A0A1X7N917_9HYPH|nr:antitoxin Xre/MbcA/ParS toxin-binding domain-containing protein [Mesorhizobium australicum]SMH33547.1 RNA polymerase, sigma 54 subunit, RpoN/SigL [Mesorhizobium australicum]
MSTALKLDHPLDTSVVAAKAVTRAADLLDVSGRDLAAIIGVSEASLSRMKRGDASFRLSGKPYELALLFVRLYRALDAIMGGDDAASRHWLRAENLALGGQPLARIRSIDGLTHVLAYLDARRAPV